MNTLQDRLKEAMSHGHLNMGAYSDDVDVKLWLPEFNGYNTTLFCDRLLKQHGEQGFFLLRTNNHDLDCVSLLNIEHQSSGFKLCDVLKGEGDDEKGTILLEVSPNYVKDELAIPDEKYIWDGFRWNYRPKPVSVLDHSHPVPTSQFGHSYILNFTVSGEFDLEIYYMPNSDAQAIWVFRKGYCCK